MRKEKSKESRRWKRLVVREKELEDGLETRLVKVLVTLSLC